MPQLAAPFVGWTGLAPQRSEEARSAYCSIRSSQGPWLSELQVMCISGGLLVKATLGPNKGEVSLLRFRGGLFGEGEADLVDVHPPASAFSDRPWQPRVRYGTLASPPRSPLVKGRHIATLTAPGADRSSRIGEDGRLAALDRAPELLFGREQEG